jgi:hypothetical protein
MRKPKINPQDVIEVAPDVVEIVVVLAKALKKDEDGKVRITREESRALLKAAKDLGLAILVATAK